MRITTECPKTGLAGLAQRGTGGIGAEWAVKKLQLTIPTMTVLPARSGISQGPSGVRHSRRAPQSRKAARSAAESLAERPQVSGLSNGKTKQTPQNDKS